jgi:hypothetical protein
MRLGAAGKSSQPGVCSRDAVLDAKVLRHPPRDRGDLAVVSTEFAIEKLHGTD